MAFDLTEINARVKADPAGFAFECEEDFNSRVQDAAARIAARRAYSPIVFLSGPSGSGKTTTAKKLCDCLKKLGVMAHTVSLDSYYVTLVPETAPRTESGELDRESPQCLDLEMIGRHLEILERGGEIEIPHFDFKTQTKVSDKHTPMKLGRDEIVIFEGIHALSDTITDGHPDAFKLYISARSNVEEDGELRFKGTWMRLVRRVVRDEFFRGAGVSHTLGMWASVRLGEKQYISPFKSKADVQLDSSMPYEVPVMKRYAELVFSKVPDGAARFAELRSILPALSAFQSITPDVVPPDSILREFIGGGVYKY